MPGSPQPSAISWEVMPLVIRCRLKVSPPRSPSRLPTWAMISAVRRAETPARRSWAWVAATTGVVSTACTTRAPCTGRWNSPDAGAWASSTASRTGCGSSGRAWASGTPRTRPRSTVASAVCSSPSRNSRTRRGRSRNRVVSCTNRVRPEMTVRRTPPVRLVAASTAAVGAPTTTAEAAAEATLMAVNSTRSAVPVIFRDRSTAAAVVPKWTP
ncbi:hypothetical protein SFUMM280S_01066 [Streptomyces fumanus]